MEAIALHEKLKEGREKQGWTQRKAAEKLGISQMAGLERENQIKLRLPIVSQPRQADQQAIHHPRHQRLCPRRWNHEARFCPPVAPHLRHRVAPSRRALETIKDLMGHSSITVTVDYVRWLASAKRGREAVDRIFG